MDENRFTSGKILVKNTFLNLLGMLIPIAVGIVTIPFAIKGLSTEGFGVLSLLWVVLGYMVLLDFGLSRATTKFTAEILGEKDHILPIIMWSSMSGSFVLGIIGTLVLLFLTPYIVEVLLKIPSGLVDQTKNSFRLFAFGLPFILFSTSLRGILGAAQRFDLVNLVHIPISVLSFIFPALSLPLHLSLSSVILLIVFFRIVASFLYFFLCINVFPAVRVKPTIDLKILRQLLSYGGWITVTGIISPLLVYIDRFFIGSLLSMKSVAFYSAPFEVIARLRIIPIAIMTTFFPEFSAVSYYNQENRLKMLFSRSVKYVLISTGMVSLFLFCYSQDILQIWLGDSFVENSTTVFQIFAMGIIINSLAYIPFNLFQSIGRPDLPAKFHLFEFPCYMVLLWWLTKEFGIIGSAISWLIRVVFDFLLLYFFVIRFFPNTFNAFSENKVWNEILLLILLGIFLISSQLLLSSLLIKILLTTGFIIIFALSVWYYIFDNLERKFIISIFQKFLYSKTSEIL